MKKLVKFILLTVLTLSMTAIVFADTPNQDICGEWVSYDRNETPNCEVTSAHELVELLNAIDFGKDIYFFALPQAANDSIATRNDEMLQFDTVEEFEIFMSNLLVSLEYTSDNDTEFSGGLPTTHDGYSFEPHGLTFHNITNSVRWWASSVSLAGWVNARLRFSLTDGMAGQTVSNIEVLDSWMTGIIGASWTHRYGSASPTGGTRARVSVSGTWLFGVSISGFPVGATWNDTRAYTLCVLS